MTTLTMGRALGAALRRAMDTDEKVLLMGEDIGKLGGVYRITDGLLKDFGAHRVIDTPLAESAIIGTAIGLAYRGYRPVCEIQFDGFVYPAFDQIVSQLAKMHTRTAGSVRLPLTIRIPYGGGIGAAEHHSESPEAYFAHTAGLRVVAAADAADAYLLLQQAIASDDPVVFFEPKRRYHTKGEVDEAAELADAPPMTSSRVLTTGEDATVVAFGSMVTTALEAAAAAADEGTSLEVIDLRSLSPIDHERITESVRRTGRCVIVHEAPREVGIGAEIAATLTEGAFEYLEAPPIRITGHDVPYPPAKLEQHQVPDLDRILDGVDRALGRVGSPAVMT